MLKLIFISAISLKSMMLIDEDRLWLFLLRFNRLPIKSVKKNHNGFKIYPTVNFY